MNVSIRVTLGIHSFGNDIDSEGGDFAISKFNVINTRVDYRIVMGTPNDASLSVALAAHYGFAGKGGAAWNHDRCLNILVPCLGSNLFLEGREVLVCLLIVHVWKCVQWVNETNFHKLSPD